MNSNMPEQNGPFGVTALLQNLLERPARVERNAAEIKDNALGCFRTGQDDGYSKGHDVGFAKGVAATLLIGAVCVTGVLWWQQKQ